MLEGEEIVGDERFIEGFLSGIFRGRHQSVEVETTYDEGKTWKTWRQFSKDAWMNAEAELRSQKKGQGR